jgi:hypothetical protein
MIQVPKGILPGRIKGQQPDFRDIWIDARREGLTREVLRQLSIRCPIEVVDDACQLAADEIKTAGVLRVSGAACPFQNLFRIAIEPDI